MRAQAVAVCVLVTVLGAAVPGHGFLRVANVPRLRARGGAAAARMEVRRVLVTGANKGIGLELVRGFAASGRHVIACCRAPGDAKDLQALAADDEHVEVHEVHVSDGDSVAALAEKIGDRPIDVLINNAGMAGPDFQNQGLANMDYEGWAETFAVNTMAPLRRPNSRSASVRPGRLCSSKGSSVS